MSSYTIKSYTCSSRVDVDTPHEEALLRLAKYLFQEGFIDVVTSFNKEEDKMEKTYYVDVQRKEDGSGKTIARRPPVKPDEVEYEDDLDDDEATQTARDTRPSPADEEMKGKHGLFSRIFGN